MIPNHPKNRVAFMVLILTFSGASIWSLVRHYRNCTPILSVESKVISRPDCSIWRQRHQE